ncbi:rRNA-processing protein las1 [Tulasnella sp. 424]|nr:rRNA-processing protein las1 [Tulasnella sp. 424]KAG8965341.1 rRNA-processing protein las1 [Tulasnella sp. 425]
MKLPRRTPWADVGELDEVCRLIYSDDSTLESKRKAANRLAAWKFNTAIPHALEITLSLLTVILEDEELASNSEPSSSSSLPNTISTAFGQKSSLALRQSYALAIVRLVNSLVDPLQQGVYARPIAAIAAQIGLPAWFVELRHQATHEDLPSLLVLREAAREALTWLLHNYFIPTISPSLPSSSSIQLSPAEPILQRYKSLVKATSKDVTLQKKRTTDFDKVFRDLERWIGEAKIASWGAMNLSAVDDEEDEWKEGWALDRLCEALLGRGGLVPVSKKKRPQPASKVSLPPNAATWSNFLTKVTTTHPSLPSRLMSNLTSIFSLPPESGSSSVSYKWSIAGWILWTTNEWGSTVDECSVEAVMRSLLTAVPKAATADDRAILKILITTLVASDPALKKKSKMLLSACDQTYEAAAANVRERNGDVEMTSADAIVSEMTDRLKKIQSSVGGGGEDVDEEGQANPTTEEMEVDRVPQAEPAAPKEIARGWRLLTSAEWTPRPVGVF